jgi:type I restriction enzyme S subunit
MSREVPEGWQLKSLGEVMDFQNGFAFKPADWCSSGLPIVRIQNLNGGGDFNFYDGYVPPQFGIKSGDILFCWSGSRGTSFGPRRWKGGEGWLNQHIFRCDLKPDIDDGFAFYLLEHLTKAIEQAAHGGAGLVHIKKSELIKFQAMMPPPHEQRRIAEILSSVDEAVVATRAVIEQTRKVKEGVLERLLTKGIGHTHFKRTEIGEMPEAWRVISYGEIFKLSSGKLKSVKSLAPERSDTSPYPAYGGNGIAGYTEEYLVDEDLIVIGRVGEYCGAAYRSSGKAWITDNALYTKEFMADVDRDFIAYAFSRVPLKYIRGGGGQPLVSQSAIYTQVLGLPSLGEQKKIVEILKSFHSSERDLQLPNLVEIKSALMSDLLTGRKRVSDALPLAAE